jgi:signal transduction histidine kinase
VTAGDPIAPPGPSRLRRWGARHPWVVDGGVAFLVALTGLPTAIHHPSLSPWTWLLSVVLALPLVWRRRAPAVVFAVVAVIGFQQWLVGFPIPADAAVLVALYTVAAYRPRRWGLAAAAVVELGVVLVAVRFLPAGDVWGSLILLSGLVAAAFFTGTSVQNRRAYLGALVDRAAVLERERDQQARLVATEERARIARELHDIVAHSLTVVVTMSEAAAVAVDADPSAARGAMTEVASTGRTALGEMRRLLGVLRADEQGADRGMTRAPTPGLDRVDELVAGARAAGLPVRLTVSGPARQLPSTLDVTAYRVVQESLTNALKHANDPTGVHVRLRWDDDDLAIDVTDDGRPADTPGGLPGHGLTGMRERLALFGGTVSSGPTPSGGWQVRAVVPLEAAP